WSRPADQKAYDVAALVEPALGDGDQRARQCEAFGNEHQGFEALVARQRAHAGRHRDRLPARGEAVLAVIEADDLIDALDADIERAVVLCDRFGIEPAAIGERSPIGAENWRHLGIGDAARPRPVVDDPAAPPPPLVAKRDEARAVSADANGGNSAEMPE